ncbi:hypothetical protein BH20ACT17_BH20ACT17_19260 [soil metagenome]
MASRSQLHSFALLHERSRKHTSRMASDVVVPSDRARCGQPLLVGGALLVDETARGSAIIGGPRLSTEVPVGAVNGLDTDGVISCDNVVTVSSSALGRQIGVLLPDQEAALSTAIRAAFDLA